MAEKKITEAEVERKITEVERKIEEAEEKKEKELLARDTRNILLGSLTSMLSSVTTLYIVNQYLIPKTAAAAVTEARKQGLLSNPSTNQLTWKPLSKEQLNYIHNILEY